MNAEYQNIINSIENGENIILHGPGGCGKSYCIKLLVSYFTDKGKIIYCTATTGIAAINLCIPEKKVVSMTLHSWAGIGTGNSLADKLLAKVKNDPFSKGRWANAQILIIDEVSMLGSKLFDNLDYIGQAIRNSDKPFGGIQMIFSGDFLQLPPVKDDWVFKSHAWKKLNLHPFIFEVPKRYDDNDYFSLLLRVRNGIIIPEDEKKLKARVKAYQKYLKMIESQEKATILIPTFLYSKKKDVDQKNDEELHKLEDKIPVEYIADDKFTALNPKAKFEHYITLLEDSIPKVITLKRGAQVMLKMNLDVKNGLVNGTRGVIVDLDTESVVVRFLNGRKMRIGKMRWEVEDKDGIGVREQVPFVLAWAITIHKCISGNSIIFTESGICQMNDVIKDEGIRDRRLLIATKKGWEYTLKTYLGNKEPSIIITTQLGYSIEGSRRHPILTRDQNGKHIWKLLPDIIQGDVIVLKKNILCGSDNYVLTEDFGSKHITEYIKEDLCYAFGCMARDYKNIKNTHNLEESILKIIKNNCNEPHIWDFLDWCGFRDGEIPWVIMKNTISSQKSFLKGLFDTYGEIRDGEIRFYSPSKKLIDQVHMLLLNIGIISRKESCHIIIPKEEMGRYQGSEISDIECTLSVFPDSPYLLEKLCLEYPNIKLPGDRITINLIPYIHKKYNLETTPIGRYLLKIYKKGLFFDKVCEISRSECIMYDFEIPGSHSFISNGIVSHNSQSCTLDYAICDLGPQVFCEGQAYVALSRIRNLKGLFIVTYYRPSIKVNKEALEYSAELDRLSLEYEEETTEEDDENDEDEDFEIILE